MTTAFALLALTALVALPGGPAATEFPADSGSAALPDWNELFDFLDPDEVGVWAGPIDPAERANRNFARSHPHVREVFEIGERLVFSVRYGPIRAGQATMHIRGIELVGRDSCYHVVTTAGSNDFFSTFFHVRDRVETFMDLHTLLPRRFEKHLIEGGFRDDEIVLMDHRNGVALYESEKRGEKIAELCPACHDVLSAFYEVRTREFSPGDVLYLDTHTGGKNYPLEVQVYRRERVRVPAGEFDCLVIEPMLRAPGLFKQEGAVEIWLTDDAHRIPVQMKSALSIGSISVVLVEVQGRSGWGGD
jgi:hypothetical protein